MFGSVRVTGPTKVKKSKKRSYTVKITNSGTGTATGVKLKVSGKGINSNSTVGTIPAGTTRTVKVKLRPTKLGKIKLLFAVTSDNAGGKSVKKTIKVSK